MMNWRYNAVPLSSDLLFVWLSQLHFPTGTIKVNSGEIFQRLGHVVVEQRSRRSFLRVCTLQNLTFHVHVFSHFRLSSESGFSEICGFIERIESRWCVCERLSWTFRRWCQNWNRSAVRFKWNISFSGPVRNANNIDMLKTLTNKNTYLIKTLKPPSSESCESPFPKGAGVPEGTGGGSFKVKKASKLSSTPNPSFAAEVTPAEPLPHAEVTKLHG